MIQLIPLASNFNKVILNDITVWFSYQTAIAYKWTHDENLYVHQNIWGVTTAKHINKVIRSIKESEDFINIITYNEDEFNQSFSGVFVE